MDYEWLMGSANTAGKSGGEWEERFTSREYQEHIVGRSARHGAGDGSAAGNRERAISA